jgi:hypothetical protein
VTDRLYDILKPIGIHVLGDAARFDRAFVGFELLVALGFADRHCEAPTNDKPEPRFWVPTGRYTGEAALREAFFKRWKDDPTLLRGAASLRAEPRFPALELFARRVGSPF